MRQPPGLVKAGDENKVLCILKPLYSLKQAAHAWNKKLTVADSLYSPHLFLFFLVYTYYLILTRTFLFLFTIVLKDLFT